MKRRSFWWVGLAAIALMLSVVISIIGQKGWIATSSPSSSFQIAQETPETGSTTPETLALSGTYEDPQGNFQVGILEGYAVSAVAGAPFFQSPDGSVAYGLVQTPLGSETPLSEIGLVEIVQQTMGQGEGFQTQTFKTVDGGLEIAWTGRFSQGSAPPQPVSGTVLVQQKGANAYLLVVAVLESATAEVPAIFSTLVNSLTIL